MEHATETTPLQPGKLSQAGENVSHREKDNPGGSFKTSFGTILTCIGCMVGTGNIWRFPRILANNSGDKGCLQFMLVWVGFLFIWSIPLILIEYGTGRYTKKATVGSFQELAGPRSAWAGAWVAVVDFGITGYYSVIVGWCIYYLYYYIAHDLPDNLDNSTAIFAEFAEESAWPVLFHSLALLLSALTVLWGVKSIELVSSIIVSTFLVLIIVCFIWSLTLDGALNGVRFMFTPDWDQFRSARMWVDAISQNAFDTGAAAGLFVSYAAYMTAENGIVRYGLFIPIGNNLVSLFCGMLTYATVFSTQSDKNLTEIVALLAENGPANTGLTFIWFPIFFGEIPGGRVFCILFFIALVFAGLSSLVANIELFVKIVEDMSGMNRKLATLICILAVFLLGLGSALDLKFLVNQDFVWGFGLLVSGLMFLYLVMRVGPAKFRHTMFNTYSTDDWYLNGVWDGLVLVIAPLEAVVLLVWWAYDTIADEGEDWYRFTPESFMSTIVQWGGALVILITTNLLVVHFRPSRFTRNSLIAEDSHVFFNKGVHSPGGPFNAYTSYHDTTDGEDDGRAHGNNFNAITFTNDNDIGTAFLSQPEDDETALMDNEKSASRSKTPTLN